jgi:hypothetical protein
MIFEHKLSGFFRGGLVGFLWVAVTVWAGLSWGVVVCIPVAFGVVVCLIAWGIDHRAAQTFDVTELRQKLAESAAVAEPEDSDVYKTTLELSVNLLEAKYGKKIPMSEIRGLQQLMDTKIAELQVQRQEAINRAAEAGRAIDIEKLRQSCVAAYTGPGGPDRDAYLMHVERFLTPLATKYGSLIPIDRAFKIMQDFEAGRGYSPDD